MTRKQRFWGTLRENGKGMIIHQICWFHVVFETNTYMSWQSLGTSQLNVQGLRVSLVANQVDPWLNVMFLFFVEYVSVRFDLLDS